ncbi:hypothetical protein [Coleofasciculus sp. D1-CHI-01]|uniref:hypothetical protein n=1 Tax=Coleofasciculus sp. D1-CHI-01 TaxID=3068482 RepID=UPI004062AF4E
MARLQVCVGAGFTTTVFELIINLTKPALTITEWLYSFPFPVPYNTLTNDE